MEETGKTYYEELIPGRLKEARKRRRVSQKEIADQLGIHVTAYGKWELGQRYPGIDRVTEIANILQLDFLFFIDPDVTLEGAIKRYQEEQERAWDTKGQFEAQLAARRLATYGLVFQGGMEPESIFDNVRDKRLITRLVETFKDWDDEALEDLLNWCLGYEQGRRKREKNKGEE